MGGERLCYPERVNQADNQPFDVHLKTMMIYTHVLNRGGRGLKSPVDLL